MDALEALAELELVDCFDDEDDDGPDLIPELDYVHEWARRRGALDAEVERYGLEAVNRLMFRGLEQTAALPGRTVAAVPDELARFWQADDAYWVGYEMGNWYNAGDVCGHQRRDELGELDEVCLLEPHDPAQGHGWDRRHVAVSW